MLWWTLQNLLIVGVLAGVVQLICRAGRVGPVGRHALWLVVLVKLLTPPLVVFDWPATIPDPLAFANRLLAAPHGPPPAARPATMVQAAEAAAGRLQVAEASPPTTLPSARETGASASPSIVSPLRLADVVRPLLPFSVAIWLAGAIVFALIQGARIGRMLLTVRASRAADPDLAARVDALARRLRLRPIQTRIVDAIASPLIWCVHPGRPVLLWPAALQSELSDDCVRGLIVHELAHVKRRDHWVGWLELAAGCAWWWNPLFWYVRSQLRESAELACDGWVIDALPRGRRAYAEALIAVCAGMPAGRAPMPAMGVSTGSRRFLERRLAMIMQERVSVRLSRVGFFCIALLAVATLPAWAQRVEPQQQPDRRSVPIRVIDRAQRPVEVVPETVVEVTPEGQRSVSTPRVQVTRNRVQAALPTEAQKLIDQFSTQEDEARREADAKIAQQRSELIKQLQAMQDTYTKANRLDDAVAVRDRIRQLEQASLRIDLTQRISSRDWLVSTPPADWTASYQPHVLRSYMVGTDAMSALSIGNYRDRVGETITLPVLGSTDGAVWGNGVYTDDSSLAAAAVHAGVVTAGQLGFVRVTILAGQSEYKGAVSHGVTSNNYGAFDGSFRVERAPEPVQLGIVREGTNVRPLLEMLRGHAGVTLTVEVVGSSEFQSVWGTDVYTDDSSIAAAAVHAGILRSGEKGLVKVTVMPGRDSYTGSARNGVTSASFAKHAGSFRIEKGK